MTQPEMKKKETAVVAWLLGASALFALWPVVRACCWVAVNVDPLWIACVLSVGFFVAAVAYVVVPEWRRLDRIEAERCKHTLERVLKQMKDTVGDDWPSEDDLPSEGDGPIG